MSPIADLDLSPYAAKLADPRGKFRWGSTRVSHAIDGYRRFLEAAGSSDAPRVPTADVDEVWHLHILDTKRYGTDCQRLFGRFVHHVPTVASTCGSCASDATCSSDVTCSSDATCSSDTTPHRREVVLTSR